MVFIIFSNTMVFCDNTLTPAPTMMLSNFSLDSMSETTLSSVPLGSRQLCNLYPSSTNLLFASCAAARTRLASHPVAVDKLRSINLESIPFRRTFFLGHIFFLSLLTKLTYASKSPILLCPLDAHLFGTLVP